MLKEISKNNKLASNWTRTKRRLWITLILKFWSAVTMNFPSEKNFRQKHILNYTFLTMKITSIEEKKNYVIDIWFGSAWKSIQLKNIKRNKITESLMKILEEKWI